MTRRGFLMERELKVDQILGAKTDRSIFIK